MSTPMDGKEPEPHLPPHESERESETEEDQEEEGEEEDVAAAANFIVSASLSATSSASIGTPATALGALIYGAPFPKEARDLQGIVWKTLLIDERGCFTDREKRAKHCILRLAADGKLGTVTLCEDARQTVAALEQESIVRLLLYQRRNVRYVKTIFDKDKELLARLLAVDDKEDTVDECLLEHYRGQRQVVRNQILAAQLLSEMRDMATIICRKFIAFTSESLDEVMLQM